MEETWEGERVPEAEAMHIVPSVRRSEKDDGVPISGGDSRVEQRVLLREGNTDSPAGKHKVPQLKLASLTM